MRKIYIKPANGIKVRDPQTGEHLPEAGAEKPRSHYWLRRLKDGDAVETKAPAMVKAATTKQGGK